MHANDRARVGSRAALRDLGWGVLPALGTLAFAAALRSTAPSPAGVGLVAPAAAVLLLAGAGAASLVALRPTIRRSGAAALLAAAGWVTLTGGGVIAIVAALTAGALPSSAVLLAAALGGAWIAAGNVAAAVKEAARRDPEVPRPALVALLFAAVEASLALALFAADLLAPLAPAVAGLAAAALVVTALAAGARGPSRMVSSGSVTAAPLLAAGLATLAFARAGALEGALGLAILGAAAVIAGRSRWEVPAAEDAGAPGAESRLTEVAATLPDGLFLVDASLDVVAIASGRGSSSMPLELTFLDREADAGTGLRGVVREIEARRAGTDVASRLTRELRSAMSELLEARRTIELQRTEIERAGHVDVLTGLPNRTAILARLAQEVAQAHRYDHPVAVLIIDVDGFGAINREHGLERGDAALRELAMRLRLRSREADALGRLSGDSFLTVLPHTDERGVTSLAEALCRRIAAHPFTDGGRDVAVTVSAGAAVLTSRSDESAEALLARAEAALATAGRQGGDRVAFDGLRRLLGPGRSPRRDEGEDARRTAEGTT